MELQHKTKKIERVKKRDQIVPHYGAGFRMMADSCLFCLDSSRSSSCTSPSAHLTIFFRKSIFFRHRYNKYVYTHTPYSSVSFACLICFSIMHERPFFYCLLFWFPYRLLRFKMSRVFWLRNVLNLLKKPSQVDVDNMTTAVDCERRRPSNNTKRLTTLNGQVTANNDRRKKKCFEFY